MIPYDIDPSLHTAEPEPKRLDDGFSPPAHEGVDAAPPHAPVSVGADVLGDKSPF